MKANTGGTKNVYSIDLKEHMQPINHFVHLKVSSVTSAVGRSVVNQVRGRQVPNPRDLDERRW